MATLFLLCSDAWLCWDREYHQENKWIYGCLYDYKMCCLSIKFAVWRFLKSIWLIILILKMFSESIWLQDEIVQGKWGQPKTRAFGEVLKFSTEKLYISDQIRWKWIKWLMIMQSRSRKFTRLISQYDRFHVTLVYDDEQVQAQRVTLSEAHSELSIVIWTSLGS